MDMINKLNNGTTFEDILIDKYIDMIKKDKLELTKKITSLISTQFNSLKNINIETIIDNNLGIELEYNGLHTINMLFEDLKELSKSIIIKLDKEIYNKETCYNIYVQEIKNSLLRNQMDWIDTLSINFIEELTKELELSQKNLTEEHIQIKIDTVKKKLNNIMSEYKIKFNESYQEILKDYIQQKLLQMKKTIIESKISHFEYPRLKKYHQIIELSNYELIEENNIYYAKNKQTNKKYELIIDGIKLRTRDNRIIFIVDEFSKFHGFVDHKKNLSVVVRNNRIDIAIDTNKDGKKDKAIITIIKTEQKYQFYYNNKIVKKLTNIEALINIIERYTKEIYNKLLFNQITNSLINEKKDYLDKDKQSIKETINNEEISIENIQDDNNQEETKNNKSSR